jgi:heat shock protein HtpX
VLLTRYADGLIGALRKIDNAGSEVQQANQATAHMYFANPFNERRRWASRLFSTHPPIADRIAALESMKGVVS